MMKNYEYCRLERKRKNAGDWVLVIPRTDEENAVASKAELEKDNPNGVYRITRVEVTETVIS